VSRRRLLFALLLVAWFCYFSYDTLSVHFAPDDMMNLAGYWRTKPAQLVTSHVLLWRGFYRPMGGVFYLPLFHLFGFNPAPYHTVILAILLANVFLVWRLTILLRGSQAAAALAALIACYHAGLSNLTYNIAFVYDVLCGFFYLVALVYYIRIREAGRAPRGREVAVFLVLFVCALNSKEMAVTLPAVLLVYEWTYQKQAALRLPFLAGLVNLPYVYGKALRPDALAADFAYRPLFSAAQVLDFQIRSFRDLFVSHAISPGTIMWVWLILFYLAFRRPRPVLRFCWIFLLISPLPIEFLPGRGGACLYVPFIGWAIFLAVVCADLAGGVSTFLASEPVFGRLGRQTLFALLLIACVSLWGRENVHLKRSFIKPAMAQTGALTWDVIGQFQAMRPRVRSHATVVFLDDPFVDWDMAFIADLWFRDRTVDIKLHRKTPLSPSEIGSATHLFDWRDGRLLQLR
jgi:hypothetical protein